VGALFSAEFQCHVIILVSKDDTTAAAISNTISKIDTFSVMADRLKNISTMWVLDKFANRF
jgi:hypothetical protein